MDTPDTLRDIQTNQLINYTVVENIDSVISVEKLDSNNFTLKALKRFKLILQNGTEANNAKALLLKSKFPGRRISFKW
jgi:hypothetical protein